VNTAAGPLRRGRSTIARIDPNRLAPPGLAVVILVSGLLLWHLTRGASFWADDWIWITTRRGDNVRTFLAPYNGHLSLVPIAIYRLMFAVFGLGSYAPYRVVIIALSLVVAVSVFAYVRVRVGAFLALLAAAALLFLGPGWQDTMWSFQIPWLIVCAAGIAALMLLDRRTLAADLGACALTLLAVASTSLGVAFAVGIAVDVALTRRGWREMWIWAMPLGLYVVWALAYHPDAIDLTELPTFPVSVAQAAAAALSALLGVSGLQPSVDPGTALTYGWPLLVVGAGLAVWRARRARPRPRAATLGVTFIVFAASVSIVHDGLADPLASRYVYVYGLLALLLIAELARGARPSGAGQLCLALVTLIAIVSNVGALRDYGVYFRNSGASTNGALTAVDLDRATVNPAATVHIALWQFIRLSAGSYFAAARTLGTPAYTVAELRGADSLAQSSADAQLLADGDVTLTAGRSRAAPNSGSQPPTIITSTNGVVTRSGSCRRFTPPAALAPGAVATIALRLPPAGVSLTAGRAAVSLSVRRFAATATPLGTLAAGRAATVTTRRDASTAPWYLQLTSIAAMRICPRAR
jgi:hypothetical protein